jgi:hypothetical protein
MEHQKPEPFGEPNAFGCQAYKIVISDISWWTDLVCKELALAYHSLKTGEPIPSRASLHGIRLTNDHIPRYIEELREVLIEELGNEPEMADAIALEFGPTLN